MAGAKRDDFLVFGSPLIGDEEIAELVDCLQSGWIGTGPKVQRFERMLEARTLSLPLSPKVTEPDRDDVVAALRHILSAPAVRAPGAMVAV
jgi:dTDP-4-amino-4,6-dideoxygalactose transaminase